MNVDLEKVWLDLNLELMIYGTLGRLFSEPWFSHLWTGAEESTSQSRDVSACVCVCVYMHVSMNDQFTRGPWGSFPDPGQECGREDRTPEDGSFESCLYAVGKY
jgi:hypothetical protein